MRFLAVSFLFYFCSLNPIWAFMPLHESGTIPTQGLYNLGISQQIITDPSNNASITVSGSRALNESSSVKLQLGTGYTNYHLMGLYKWIPYPDYEKQPAIGGFAGVTLAKPDDVSQFGFISGPLISKKIPSQFGDFDGYTAIPLYLVNFDGDVVMGGQLVLGSVWIPKELEHVKFSAELGLKLNDNSFTYISINATVDYDPLEGFQFK